MIREISLDSTEYLDKISSIIGFKRFLPYIVKCVVSDNGNYDFRLTNNIWLYLDEDNTLAVITNEDFYDGYSECGEYEGGDSIMEYLKSINFSDHTNQEDEAFLDWLYNIIIGDKLKEFIDGE